MTFYEKLQKHLTTKQYVLVQKIDGDYCIFSHAKNENGNYRYSDWWSSKERAMPRIGSCPGYGEQQLNECAEEASWKILKAFDIPTKQFKKGDIVMVDENAQELCKEANLGWGEEKKAMIGKECEIEGVSGSDYYVYTPEGATYLMLPHTALSYPIDRTITKQDIAKRFNIPLDEIDEWTIDNEPIRPTEDSKETEDSRDSRPTTKIKNILARIKKQLWKKLT